MDADDDSAVGTNDYTEDAQIMGNISDRSPGPRVIYTDQGDFLNKIHKNFLQFVDPVDSLLDILQAEGGLCQDEVEEIRSHTTSRDKARGLWFSLHRLPPRFFKKFCMPALKVRYPHVLQGADFCYEEQSDLGGRCLRHVIMKRIQLKRFADIFPSCKACTLDEYRNDHDCCRKLTGRDGKWKTAFWLLMKHSKNDGLRQSVRKMLQDIGVHLSSFNSLFRKGLPCTCKRPPNTACSDQLSVPAPREQTSSSSSVECAASDESMESSDIDASDDSSDMDQGRESGGSSSFHSRNERDHVKDMIKKINSAITDASMIETMYRELECYSEEVRFTVETRQYDEHYVAEDRKQLLCLQDKAAKAWRNIKILHQQLKKKSADCSAVNSTSFPPWVNVKLIMRSNLLKKKAKQAEKVRKQSLALINKIQTTVRVRSRN